MIPLAQNCPTKFKKIFFTQTTRRH